MVLNPPVEQQIEGYVSSTLQIGDEWKSLTLEIYESPTSDLKDTVEVYTPSNQFDEKFFQNNVRVFGQFHFIRVENFLRTYKKLEKTERQKERSQRSQEFNLMQSLSIALGIGDFTTKKVIDYFKAERIEILP